MAQLDAFNNAYYQELTGFQTQIREETGITLIANKSVKTENLTGDLAGTVIEERADGKHLQSHQRTDGRDDWLVQRNHIEYQPHRAGCQAHGKGHRGRPRLLCLPAPVYDQHPEARL